MSSVLMCTGRRTTTGNVTTRPSRNTYATPRSPRATVLSPSWTLGPSRSSSSRTYARSISGSKATIDAVVERAPFVTSISLAPFTTCAAVSTSTGATTIPLPCASPVEQPDTASPTTPDGGSGAHPAATATTKIAPIARARRATVGSDTDVNVLCDAVTDPVDHPLAGVLRDAAHGVFPPVDGLAELLPPDAAGTCSVVSFTGHAYVLT